MDKIEDYYKSITNSEIKILKFYLRNKDFCTYSICEQSIKIAYENKNIEILQLIFNRVVSKYGYVELAELLLKDYNIDPSTEENLAIRDASKLGHIKIVRLLLKDKRVDASDKFNWSIEWAILNKHYDISHILWKNENVKKALLVDNKELFEKLKIKYLKTKICAF